MFPITPNYPFRRQQPAFAFHAPAIPLRARASAQASPGGSEQLARVACRVHYNGAQFNGWESKPGMRTVEGLISARLNQIVGASVDVTAVSRTDAGAHAVGQVIHFDVHKRKRMTNPRAWVGALNRRLPQDIRVVEAAFPSPVFDARRSALWRRYRYTILTAATPSVFLAPFTWHYYQRDLDVPKMHAAAQLLCGPTWRDLSAFRKAGAAAAHTRISVSDIAVRRAGPNDALVEVDVRATWFVYGMMRLLTAALVEVGGGKLSVDEFGEIVRKGKRTDVRFSAPASGLCLMEAGYPPNLYPFAESTDLTGIMPRDITGLTLSHAKD